jgi:hypothetical protein
MLQPITVGAMMTTALAGADYASGKVGDPLPPSP